MNRFIANASRDPRHTLNAVSACPALLADESSDTVKAVAKIWVREGLADELMGLVENGAGMPADAKRIIRHIVLCRMPRRSH